MDDVSISNSITENTEDSILPEIPGEASEIVEAVSSQEDEPVVVEENSGEHHDTAAADEDIETILTAAGESMDDDAEPEETSAEVVEVAEEQQPTSPSESEDSGLIATEEEAVPMADEPDLPEETPVDREIDNIDEPEAEAILTETETPVELTGEQGDDLSPAEESLAEENSASVLDESVVQALDETDNELEDITFAIDEAGEELAAIAESIEETTMAAEEILTDASDDHPSPLLPESPQMPDEMPASTCEQIPEALPMDGFSVQGVRDGVEQLKSNVQTGFDRAIHVIDEVVQAQEKAEHALTQTAVLERVTKEAEEIGRSCDDNKADMEQTEAAY